MSLYRFDGDQQDTFDNSHLKRESRRLTILEDRRNASWLVCTMGSKCAVSPEAMFDT